MQLPSSPALARPAGRRLQASEVGQMRERVTPMLHNALSARSTPSEMQAAAGQLSPCLPRLTEPAATANSSTASLPEWPIALNKVLSLQNVRPRDRERLPSDILTFHPVACQQCCLLLALKSELLVGMTMSNAVGCIQSRQLACRGRVGSWGVTPDVCVFQMDTNN